MQQLLSTGIITCLLFSELSRYSRHDQLHLDSTYSPGPDCGRVGRSLPERPGPDSHGHAINGSNLPGTKEMHSGAQHMVPTTAASISQALNCHI